MRLYVRTGDVSVLPDRRISAPVPDQWLDELVRLNDLPVLETMLRDGVPSILTEQEVRDQHQSLDFVWTVVSQTPALFKEFAERVQAHPSGRDLILSEMRSRPDVVVAVEERRAEALRQTLKLVRSARAEALKSERLLAPIGADPLRETREFFEERARTHWEARVAQAATMGYVPVRPKPSLHLHMRWLVRYQLARESFSEIARTRGEETTRTAVTLAVRSLARLIGLALRPSQRGGARPHSAPRPRQRKKRQATRF